MAVTNNMNHRAVMARRSREQSLLDRDISPLPPVRYPQRRIAARSSLRTFCETYFPEKFALEWSSYHLDVIKRLETILTGGGKLALAMPRGSGKTTLAFVAAIWATLYGYRKFLVIVASNKKEAKKILDAVKTAMMNNRALLEDFPETVYPLHRLKGSALLARGQLYLGELTNIGWSGDEIVFPTIPGSKASGCRIVTVGMTGSIRGKSTEMPDGTTARPDQVLIDDPQTDKSARSAVQVAKLEETIEKTIEGLVGPGQELAIVMTCTVIQEGDLADLFLNPRQKPLWKGLRFKMVEQMPERMDLWERYRDLHKEDHAAATEFYRSNLVAMRKGAVVAWEANYSKETLDALQFAMNKWAENYASFMSEMQNEPLRPDMGAVVVPSKKIRSRLNGLDRLTVPLEATHLTGFIDIHEDLLYYAVTAWSDDFTGFVVDYGTYPKQRRKEFAKGDTDLLTLRQENDGSRTDAAIQLGLTNLLKDLLATVWDVEGDKDGVEQRLFSRIFIDSGFKWKVVENAIRLAGDRYTASIIMPSKGHGVKSTGKPMGQWPKRDGRRFGHYWLIDTPQGRPRKYVTYDTNYWKCQVHDAFSQAAGDRGGLTLWGRDPEQHRMFSEHLNGEVAKLVESGENKVNEWTAIPGKDNHLFDCMVGCMVAASVCGVKPPEEQAARPAKRRRRSS